MGTAEGVDETSGIAKQQEQAKQGRDSLKDLGLIWHPYLEPEAKERVAHGDIGLTSMDDALDRPEVLEAQMAPAQAAQLKTDFEFFSHQTVNDEIRATLALLGRETVDKVRQPVYVRAAARCLERELQADLRLGSGRRPTPGSRSCGSTSRSRQEPSDCTWN